MKKTIMLCVILALFCAAAFAEEAERETFVSGDYEYALLDDGTAEIVGYSGSDEELAIPSNLDGYIVTSIGDKAFYNRWNLKCVIIPDSVTSIGNRAFESCGLTSITIPDSVTSIGNRAFEACGMTSITIPDSVTSIGDGAFIGSLLTSITIPDSVTSIGWNPFAGCLSLTSIKVSPDHPTLATIDGVLFSKADRQLVCYPCTFTPTHYSIPQGIQIIGPYAFSRCDLTSIAVPDSVTSIGFCAFYVCDKLTSIAIPDSVTSIGWGAFWHCESLTSITIPDGVASIEYETFYFCYGLTSVTIPDSVASIGIRAFYHCFNLTSVTIPDGVTSIGESAFSVCSRLTDITIPDSVTSIGVWAFALCENLTCFVGRESYARQYCIENDIACSY